MSTIKFTPDDGPGTVSRDVFQSVCNELADARNEVERLQILLDVYRRAFTDMHNIARGLIDAVRDL